MAAERSFDSAEVGAPSLMQVTIVGTEIKEDARGKSFTVYRVAVGKDDIIEWFVEHRYSNFLRLDEALHDEYPGHNLPLKLPKKRLLSSLSPDTVEDRKVGLERYLQQMVECLPESEVLARFLSDNMLLPDAKESVAYTREGYLKKRGRRFGQYKTRWFVLTGFALDYFRSRHALAPAGSFPLLGARVATVNDPANALSLTVAGEPGEPHVFIAESTDERDAWVVALTAHAEMLAPPSAAAGGAAGGVRSSGAAELAATSVAVNDPTAAAAAVGATPPAAPPRRRHGDAAASQRRPKRDSTRSLYLYDSDDDAPAEMPQYGTHNPFASVTSSTASGVAVQASSTSVEQLRSQITTLELALETEMERARLWEERARSAEARLSEMRGGRDDYDDDDDVGAGLDDSAGGYPMPPVRHVRSGNAAGESGATPLNLESLSAGIDSRRAGGEPPSSASSP